MQIIIALISRAYHVQLKNIAPVCHPSSVNRLFRILWRLIDDFITMFKRTRNW